MARSKRSASPRFRVGRISVYPHHGTWWVCYRDGGKQVRRKVATTRQEAEQVAAQLTSGAPTLLAFTSIGVPGLRQKFLDFHEHTLGSSVATARRYRAATRHLEVYTSR